MEELVPVVGHFFVVHVELELELLVVDVPELAADPGVPARLDLVAEMHAHIELVRCWDDRVEELDYGDLMSRREEKNVLSNNKNKNNNDKKTNNNS